MERVIQPFISKTDLFYSQLFKDKGRWGELATIWCEEQCNNSALLDTEIWHEQLHLSTVQGGRKDLPSSFAFCRAAKSKQNSHRQQGKYRCLQQKLLSTVARLLPLTDHTSQTGKILSGWFIYMDLAPVRKCVSPDQGMSDLVYSC